MSEPGTTPPSSEPDSSNAAPSPDPAGTGPPNESASHLTHQGPYMSYAPPPPPPPPPHYPHPVGPPAAMAHYGYPQWQLVQRPVWQPQLDGFPLWIPTLPKIPSGPGIGGMIASIAGIPLALLALLVALGAPVVSLFFLIPAVFFGTGGGIVLSLVSLRRIKRFPQRFSGRGIALAGFIMGIIASSLAAITLFIALANL